MKNSKVIIFLQSLDAAEFARFRKFVHSPFFNTHEKTTELFELLASSYPTFEPEQVDKKRIFSKLYPDSAYDNNKLYVLKNYLLSLLMQFMAMEEKDVYYGVEHTYRLVRSMRRRNLDKYIGGVIRDGNKALEEIPFRNPSFYYHGYKWEDETLSYKITQENRNQKATFKELLDNLDYFFLSQKLRYACTLLNRKAVVAVDEELSFMDEVLSYCGKHSFDHIPVVAIYYELLMLMLEENVDKQAQHYEKLCKLMHKHDGIFSDTEDINVSGLIANYCSRQYKRGHSHYFREMFEWYKRMCRWPKFFRSGRASLIMFRNMVKLGIRLKEYQWTEEFIRANKDKIDIQYREGLAHFNLASLFFVREQYGKSLRYLQKVEFIDSYNRLDYNILLLKTYYECGYIEALLSLYSTFTTYIRRNKALSQTNREAYMNFARFTRKLFGMKYDLTKRGVKPMSKKVRECKLLLERNWLEEKALEIEEDYGLLED